MFQTTSFYDAHADVLAKQYNSVSFESVHQSWRAYWPSAGASVLDVGAGSGRDAKWCSAQGCEVIAVEPSDLLRDIGKHSTGPNVTWLKDSLPGLENTLTLGMRFDLILVSAVWMHIPSSKRERAFRKLSYLLAPNGKLVISLRHGEFDDGRHSFPVSVDEIKRYANERALQMELVTDSDDSLQRSGVHWQTVVLSLPDDRSGSLNTVRRIVINDSKSATYKLALLRTLLRIADAHPGAVMERADGKITLPAGLVALYWVRQFKRLIDVDIQGMGIQQNSNSSKGLGFVKEDGWHQLNHLAADDFAIGALFMGDDTKAIQKLFSHTLATIKSGPVTFIYQGSKDNRLFELCSPSSRRKRQDSVVLDGAFFASYGEFVLDESLWECFRLYHSWIEPLVVNQWVKEMQRFELNRQRDIALHTYHDCLVWIDAAHDTRDVRQRVEELKGQGKEIVSVWSGKPLADAYHVDHCLPFAYWPNNDKWNLLPTTSAENLKKSDRLPTVKRLHDSRVRILDWWNVAWGNDVHRQRRFFTEAALSLPNLPAACTDFEEVFEAMGLQVRGVKSRLLVSEW